MNKLFWKKLLDESNLLILIPAIVIVASLVFFLIFGLSSPETTGIYESSALVEIQQSYESSYLAAYVITGSHSDDSPYFILNPYKMAPLSGLLMFETEVATQYKVIIKGKSEEADFEYITEELNVHRIPIYGLYPGTRNIIELYKFDGVDTYTMVYVQYVNTAVLPDTVKLPVLIDTTYEYFGDDLMITSSSNSNLPVGYDFNGDVRWYLSEELSWTSKQLSNGHFLFGSRDLGSPYYSTELLEIDYLGKVYAQYNIPGGYHHDYSELPSGNLLVATNDFEGSIEDIIVEIDRATGEIVKTFDMADYINPLDGASEMWTTTDWFHITSIFYDELTDSIIVSGSYQDIIISIGYTSNELNWVIGDPTNWDPVFVLDYFFTPIGDNFEWQYAQNDVVVLDNGDIFVFDNGVNKSKLRETDIPLNETYSRGVIYNIDTTLMTIEQIFEYGKELGIDFYSSYNSNIDYYSDGNYLIHSGGHLVINFELLVSSSYIIGQEDAIYELSITVEVMDGVEVYRMEIKGYLYQAIRVSIYENTVNYSPIDGIVVGAQLETLEYTGSIDKKMNLFDTVPLDYNLVFNKEFDRFVIQGTFDQNQLVYLVLENSYGSKEYLIPINTDVFSAICFDDCHDEQLDITFFVNEEGMNGKYNIFIIIDGKKYNTYKSVIFK